ncbi:MAG: hypothetical protein ACOCRK_10835 [bacterium]
MYKAGDKLKGNYSGDIYKVKQIFKKANQMLLKNCNRNNYVVSPIITSPYTKIEEPKYNIGDKVKWIGLYTCNKGKIIFISPTKDTSLKRFIYIIKDNLGKYNYVKENDIISKEK